ncbi:hypothetical protein RJ035_000795 [Blastomyces gilchristii]
MDSTTANGGPVMAEDNIINRRGGESLFQSCASLKKRLTEVPGFEAHLAEMEKMDKAEDAIDPVASVWRCLRQGYPLMTIFNASNPAEPLTIDTDKVPEARRPKAAAFKFLQACLQDLEFPQQDCFLITDLYGENTTGFVKVIKMVSRVLDILEMRGQLYQTSTASAVPHQGEKVKLTRKEHILKELLETERDYVHHLQNLQALKKELEETGALNGDSSHQIFLNLNNLLDFAQRFLIRMEQHNALPEDMQNWGELFIQHQEGFRQYEPFIANQLRCDAVCQKEWDKIKAAPRSVDLQQMVAQPSTLNGFFVKPFQRLTKYPLMLMELKKQTDREDLIADVATAIDIVQTVLDRANHAVDKEHLANAVDDLASRVDDWKALNVEIFGELLRFGTFTVLKADVGRDAEREVRTSLTAYNARLRPASQRRLSFHRGPIRVRLRLLYTLPLAPDQAFHKKLPGYHIYLFERILLCCKDANLNKQKTKLMSKDKPNAAPKGKPRLQLKGRIYMANVTEILSLHKPGSYKIQIFWKGDPGVVDNFVIRYQNEDTMRKWYKDIDTQRAIQTEERATRHTGTSETEFTYLKMGPKIQNPYREEYEAEEELVREGNTFSEFSVSRNASSTSLRARSATGGSGSSGPISSRPPPPRFPMPEPPLSVSTQFANGAISPGDRNGNSYFSPVTDPTSSRSSQSTMFAYSRQGTPSTPWIEDSNRTATQSPGIQQRHGLPPNPFPEPQLSGRIESRSQPAPTSNPMQSGLSSPVNQEAEQELYMPSQLKAKVNFDDNYVTLVIASNILFRSLTDRVDAKLARFTDRSIGNKSVRLRYRDEDGDFVTIDSDEAVQLAFMEWRDQHQNMLANGQVGEIQLFCQPVEN